MGLREMAGDMARASSGVWKGIAEAVDPGGARPKRETTAAPSAAPSAPPEPGADEATGTMVVPLDSWTRILDQLGNLHEAGQQLAEARERAARAEAENEFLRAQVRELKEKAGRRRAPAAPRAPEPPSASAPEPVPPVTETRSVRARRVVSRWLSPE